MHRDARGAVLAALRECFDGSWDRHVGVDGGKTLHWDGKLGLIAGVTTVVDSHHAVMDSLGSRFAFYRVDVDYRAAQGTRALDHRAGARTMRAELRDAVTGFFAGLELPAEDTLTDADKERLVTLADLVTMARSPVERDRVSRDIELIPDPEAPARFALMLAGLLEGLRVIGLADEHAWRLVTKTAFDSMPAQRRRVLELLADTAEATTKQVALELGLPTTTARRTLEDLAAHRLVLRESSDGKSDTWRFSAWTQEKYRR
jgi:IclR helix-turn-helix domain